MYDDCRDTRKYSCTYTQFNKSEDATPLLPLITPVMFVFFYICCCCITIVQFRRKSWKNGRVTMWRHRRATASGCIVTSRAFRLPMSCGIADLFPVATFMTVDSELSTLVKIIFEVVLRESVKALDFRWRSAFLLLFRVYKTTCVFVFVFMCNVVTLLII